MFAALAASLIFTFTYATLAAKSRRAEMVLIPLLDILQSVPILGFLSFTVDLLPGLFPGHVLGAELAAIFAIFTSQAWNMAFSFYQSLRTVPRDLDEVARGFRLTGWQRFWRLEVPFAMPGLIWNTMMSMSGGWFFVVASEAITVGNTTITLPGVGSYIAMANNEGDLVGDRRGRLDHGDRDPALRSAAVPPARGLGRQVPGRTVREPGCRVLLGARADQAHALAETGLRARSPPALRSFSFLPMQFSPLRAGDRQGESARPFAASSTRSGSSSSSPWPLGGLAHRLLYRHRTDWDEVRPGLRPDLLHLSARRPPDGVWPLSSGCRSASGSA